jgi:hypothetical protein
MLAPIFSIYEEIRPVRRTLPYDALPVIISLLVQGSIQKLGASSPKQLAASVATRAFDFVVSRQAASSTEDLMPKASAAPAATASDLPHPKSITIAQFLAWCGPKKLAMLGTCVSLAFVKSSAMLCIAEGAGLSTLNGTATSSASMALSTASATQSEPPSPSGSSVAGDMDNASGAGAGAGVAGATAAATGGTGRSQPPTRRRSSADAPRSASGSKSGGGGAAAGAGSEGAVREGLGLGLGPGMGTSARTLDMSQPSGPAVVSLFGAEQHYHEGKRRSQDGRPGGSSSHNIGSGFASSAGLPSFGGTGDAAAGSTAATASAPITSPTAPSRHASSFRTPRSAPASAGEAAPGSASASGSGLRDKRRERPTDSPSREGSGSPAGDGSAPRKRREQREDGLGLGLPVADLNFSSAAFDPGQPPPHSSGKKSRAGGGGGGGGTSGGSGSGSGSAMPRHKSAVELGRRQHSSGSVSTAPGRPASSMNIFGASASSASASAAPALAATAIPSFSAPGPAGDATRSGATTQVDEASPLRSVPSESSVFSDANNNRGRASSRERLAPAPTPASRDGAALFGMLIH